MIVERLDIGPDEFAGGDRLGDQAGGCLRA